MNTSITFRTPEEDGDVEGFTQLVERTFRSMSQEPSRYAQQIGRDNLRIALLDGRVVGTVALIPCGQYFGGRRVDMHGVAAVAVNPLLRGRGIAMTMMNETVRELHERGVAISTLYPATQPLYRASCYEQAGESLVLTVELRQIAAAPSDLEVRELTEIREDVRALERRRAMMTPGALDRSLFFWTRIRHTGSDELRTGVGAFGPDGLEGCLWYELTDCDVSTYAINVRDLVAMTAPAARALIGHLRSFRTLAARAMIPVSSADAILHAIDEQRYRITSREIWMTRIVSVPHAIEQRGWPVGYRGELHLDVSDDLLPANGGRWRIEIEDGRATVARGGEGRLALDVRGLASMFTGYRSPAQLQQTGQLDGPAEDVALAATAFASPTPCLFDRF